MIYTVIVRPEPPGRFTARVYGIPEVCAEAETDIEAIQQAHRALEAWLASARLVSVTVPNPPAINPLVLSAGHAKDDADLEQYQEDIRRFKREADERFKREVDEQACANSSSTPTT